MTKISHPGIEMSGIPEEMIDRYIDVLLNPRPSWRTNFSEDTLGSPPCLKCSWLNESFKNYGRCERHNIENLKVKHHDGNGKPKGLFAGTLTMSKDDKFNEEDMIHAIKKIMAQETCPVEKYAWYLEYQDNGSPHIHFIYKTKAEGRIHAKVFKRYWKIWDESKKLGKGFRGGYHSKVDSETAYLEYIEKDGGRHQDNWLQ